MAETVLRRGARDQNTRRRGGDQRRDLRHQTIADRQQREPLQRLRHRHVFLHDTDREPTYDIDQRDENRSHRITLSESDGAIHGAVEFGFLADLHPPFAGFLLIDDSSVQVGINRKLLARQRVQRESGSDFRNTNRAVIDHDVLDYDQNQENDDSNCVVPADNELV